MDKKNNILMGIFCIIVAGFGFSLMSLFIKLAGDLPSMQKGFFRNIIAVGISSIPLIKHWKVINLPKDNIEWSVLISRSVFGTICNNSYKSSRFNYNTKVITVCNFNIVFYFL